VRLSKTFLCFTLANPAAETSSFASQHIDIDFRLIYVHLQLWYHRVNARQNVIEELILTKSITELLSMVPYSSLG